MKELTRYTLQGRGATRPLHPRVYRIGRNDHNVRPTSLASVPQTLISARFYALIPATFKKSSFFKKVAQNMIKTGPKPGPCTSVSQSLIQVLEGYFSVFFRTLKIHNSNYQGTATFRHPSYPLGKNQLLSGRTYERTDGRTDMI